jgi:hypothetical protein
MDGTAFPFERTVRLGDAPTAAADLSDEEQAAVADGVAFLVDAFGADAEVTLSSMTSGERAMLDDRIRDGRVGDPGPRTKENFVVALGVDDAPWLEGGEDLETKVQILADSPPQVVDWLSVELDDLNDLSGND